MLIREVREREGIVRWSLLDCRLELLGGQWGRHQGKPEQLEITRLALL